MAPPDDLAAEHPDFHDSALQRSDSFRKATLERLDFSDADLGGADFRDAVFEGGSLRDSDPGGLRLTDATKFQGTLSHAQAALLVAELGLRVA
jgi:uncharacterized protein YjbI with pentapeptide repeats